MTKKEIEGMIAKVVNIPIWQAKKGVGSFITFDMGEKVTQTKRNGSKSVTGKIHLWIYLCDWTILSNGKIIIQSDSSEDDIVKAIDMFIGRNIVSINISESNKVDIKFSDEISLILIGNAKAYGVDGDFFNLYTPECSISYNMKTGLIAELPDSVQNSP
jgi:hypothetical protein